MSQLIDLAIAALISISGRAVAVFLVVATLIAAGTVVIWIV